MSDFAAKGTAMLCPYTSLLVRPRRGRLRKQTGEADSGAVHLVTDI